MPVLSRRPDVSLLHHAAKRDWPLHDGRTRSGLFRLYGKGDSQMAVNEANNAGLFRDMQPPARPHAGAAQPPRRAPAGRCGYADLRAQIVNLVDPGSRAIMRTRHPFLVSGVLTLLLLTSVQVYAGGPLLLRAPGAPFLWPNGGRMIPFNPDQGGLGPLTNAQAVAQTTARSRPGQTSPRPPRRTSTPGRCRSTWTRRTSCRICRPPHQMG